MNVSDIMTKPVVSVMPETPIGEVARLMLQHRISGLPVVDEQGSVVGIITEGDLLRRVETGTERRHRHWVELLIGPGRLAREYALAHARRAGEMMSTDIISVTPEAALDEIVALMERHHVKRLPVIEGGKLVGIVSRANMVRALVHNLAKTAATAVGEGTADEDIRERILAEIDKQPWGPRASVDVRVAAGIVELHGSITDERERTALRVLAENIPGVTAVRDHLVWVEPMSGLAIPPDGSVTPQA
jgi:CBS-domain-containing membrane protein